MYIKKMMVMFCHMITCFICRGKHGEIYLASEIHMEKPAIHHNCRCVIKKMDAGFVVQGTKFFVKFYLENGYKL